MGTIAGYTFNASTGAGVAAQVNMEGLPSFFTGSGGGFYYNMINATVGRSYRISVSEPLPSGYSWAHHCIGGTQTGRSLDCSTGWISGGVAYVSVPTAGATLKLRWKFTPTTPTNVQPIGTFDGASCTNIQGWACDQTNWPTALTVRIYDGVYISGKQPVAQGTANLSRESAVGTVCGNGTSNHGFSFTTPTALKDNFTHYLYAYAVDINSGLIANNYLTGSPKSIKCAGPAPTDTTPPTISFASPASGATFAPGQTITITANASDNVAISNVLLSPNGQLFQETRDYTSPYSLSIPVTATTPQGQHCIYATAYDTNGNNRVVGPHCFTISSGPTVTGATINSSSITPDGLTQYTMSVSASDPNGSSDIASLYEIINHQGTNNGQHRGYLMWSTQNFPHANNAFRQGPITCSGGGQGALFDGYGSINMNLISCSTTVSGNSRTATFVVTFSPRFTAPVTSNTLSGWVSDVARAENGWAQFNTFSLSNQKPTLRYVADYELPTDISAFAPVSTFIRYCANIATPTISTTDPKIGRGTINFTGTDDCAGNDSRHYYTIANTSISIGTSTTLEYKILPQNENGKNIAVSFQLDDGTYLHNLGIYAEDAVRMSPEEQRNHANFNINVWKTIKVNLGKLSGRTIQKIIVGYNDNQFSDIGVVSTRIDDILIYDKPIGRKYPLGTKAMLKTSNSVFSGPNAVQNLGTQSEFVEGTVIDGPITNTNGTIYWNINFNSGVDGWVPDNLLGYTEAQVNQAALVSGNTCFTTKGDIDCSGGQSPVSVTDGVNILRCAAGLAPCSSGTIDPDFIVKADMTCDGQVTVTDGVKALRKAAGLTVFFPCPDPGTSPGTIQGFILSKGTGDGLSATLTLQSTGARYTTVKPKYSYSISATGNQTVSIEIPPGYSKAEYNLCINSDACVNINPWVTGNSVTISVPSGGFARLWWALTPKNVFSSPVPPPTTLAGGWTFCANNGQNCVFTGTKEVRYGANGVFTDTAKNGLRAFTGGTMCDTNVFNDPIPGVAKQCQYRTGKLQTNARVVSIFKNPITVHSSANGPVLGNQSLIAQGTVIGGPTSSGGAQWLNVNFDSGLDGWVKELYLYYVDQTQLTAGINVLHGGLYATKGDVDDSGGNNPYSEPREEISIIDGILALKCADGQFPCAAGSDKFYASDVDCNNVVNGDDGNAILNLAAHNPVAIKIYQCIEDSYRSLAGGYHLRDNNDCTSQNPLTGGCSCPAGFRGVNFASVRGTDKAFLSPGFGAVEELKSDSFSGKILNTYGAFADFPDLPAYIDPFLGLPSLPSAEKIIINFGFWGINQINILPFELPVSNLVPSLTVTFEIPGITAPIPYVQILIMLIKTGVTELLQALKGPYTPGSPGFDYMCVRNQYSSTYGYQGGYSTQWIYDEAGTQRNDLTTNDYSCPAGTVKDLVGRGLKKKIVDQDDQNFMYIWSCRNPNTMLAGTSRDSYGGMYQTNLDGDCITGNVIGDQSITEAWRTDSTGVLTYRSLLGKAYGLRGATIQYSCSCRTGYLPIPIASMSDWDEKPGILYLCSLPPVTEVHSPAVSVDKGLIRVRITDAGSNGVSASAGLQSIKTQSTQQTMPENRYSVVWSDLPTPIGGTGYSYGAMHYQLRIGMPRGYTKAAMAICENDDTCPNASTRFQEMIVSNDHDATGQGLRDAFWDVVLKAGTYMDLYVILAP